MEITKFLRGHAQAMRGQRQFIGCGSRSWRVSGMELEHVLSGARHRRLLALGSFYIEL
jgi:hypothetical protein